MCQISRQLDNVFVFYSNFYNYVQKDKEGKYGKKIKTLAARILEMAGAISFTFGMWTPLTGRQLCSKCGSNRIRDHRDTKV